MSKKLRELIKQIKNVNSEIIDILNEAVNSKSVSDNYYETQLTKLKVRYAKLYREFKSYIEKEFPAMFLIDADKFNRELGEDILKLTKKNLDNTQIKVIVQDSLQYMLKACSGGLIDCERILLETKQLAIAEHKINKAIARGLKAGENPRTFGAAIAKMLKRKLAGNTLTIKGRNYNPAKYAELVARTRGREIQSIAAIETLKSYGLDLCKISSHSTTTQVCKQYEGKIFSLTGKNATIIKNRKEITYPVLTKKPPFHPGCKHVIIPYITR